MLIVIHHVHHVMDHQNHNVSYVVQTDFHMKVNVSTHVQMASLAIKSVRSACNVLLDVPLVAATHVWHVKRTGWRIKRTNVLPTAAVIAMNVSKLNILYIHNIIISPKKGTTHVPYRILLYSLVSIFAKCFLSLLLT